jgi:hypothetical protein
VLSGKQLVGDHNKKGSNDGEKEMLTEPYFVQPANSFVAKEMCNMREYEYLLPLDLVHDQAEGLSDEAKQDLMAKLNKVALCKPFC